MFNRRSELSIRVRADGSRSLGCLICAAVCLAACPDARAQVHWRGSDSITGPRVLAAGGRGVAVVQQETQRSRAQHLILYFESALADRDRVALRAAGIEVQGYLGGNAYFAAVIPAVVAAAPANAVPALAAAEAISAERKLHPVLARGERPAWAVVAPRAGADRPDASGERIVAYVLFFPDVEDAAINALARQHAVAIRSRLRTVNGVVAELPLDAVTAMAHADAVQYIEPALPRMDVVNDGNRLATQAETVQAAPYNLDGAGVSVLVYDAGTARASHLDFGGRLTVRDASAMGDHPTHVSGTIGGDGGASGGLWRGMAPAVRIESYGFETGGPLQAGFLYTDPGDIEADYADAINTNGVDIANNSIGTNTAPNGFPCDWEGDYGVTDTVIDSIVRGGLGSPFRIIWANGNERQGAQSCGGGYHTTAPPACAKNHITVGALNSNDDSVTAFTSWGPADDGRLKPDISAPGCQSDGDLGVTSPTAGSDTEYSSFCGTSMAAPTVTGVAALLLQGYRARHPGASDFRNSTLKALLAHNAEDIEAPGPDYKTGYGAVRIQRTVDFMHTDRFLEAEVQQATRFALVAFVAPGESELKVTLAWDDPPGVPNVSPALVNDLDIRVFDPVGVQHFPWTLGGIADPAAPAVRAAPDRLNNLEQVSVETPSSGLWRVEVHGFNVPQGPQPFSLCLSVPFLGDCNTNGISDYADVTGGTSVDCNTNYVPDECEPAADCNANGVTDICDIGAGTSADVNSNSVADECEPDCNGNDFPDDHDIGTGQSGDCNGTAVPDECEITAATSLDCNADSVPDECEPDCNGNSVADTCDLAGGISTDCDANGVPDECQADCNHNGIPDTCDIAGGTSTDLNTNGYPDECHLLYVSTNALGANDGTSWTDAYTDLQAALAFARVNPQIDEIWVAAGTYAPGPVGDESATFQLLSGVSLYGGFAGWEKTRGQREVATHHTILSGDIGRDDVYGSGVWYIGWNRNTANSAHVVTGSGTDATARLDGFTIVAGSTGANGTPAGSPDMYGGGLYNIAGSPTIANCTFKRNLAAFAHGGGVYNSDSSPTFTNCIFIENYVHLGQGAAIANVGNSSPVIIDSAFVRNRCVGSGSGGEGAGGAISHYSTTALSVRGCLFDHNEAANFYPQGQSAGTYAGAIFIFTGSLSVKNGTFIGNTSNAGGAIYTFGDATIETSLFANNAAPSYNSTVGWGGIGGALGCQSFAGTNVRVTGCTVVNNTAEDSGGLDAYGSAALTVTNSILWNNSDNSGTVGKAQLGGGSASYCCIHNMFVAAPDDDPPNPADFPGCTDADPQFINLNTDRRLLPTSPCVDTGDPAFSGQNTFDLDGRPRVLCSRVDMGAYETTTALYTCSNPPSPVEYGYWVYCMNGPQQPHLGPDCSAYDFDVDGDVDLRDFSAMQPLIGAGVPRLNPPATIAGSVSASGTGTIFVTAASVDGAHMFDAELPAPGPYLLSIDIAAEYTVSAYRDTNGNGVFNSGEPSGAAPQSPIAIVTPGQAEAGVDLLLSTGRSIQGTVTRSTGGGEFNTLLTLTGAVNVSTSTDGSGIYAFANLPAGLYTVTPSKANRYFYPFNRPVDLTASDAIGIDFTVHVLPTGEVDGEDTGVVTAVDAAGYSLNLDVSGTSLTLFIYADTIFSGDASELSEVQPGWTVTAQYYTSANLAVELDCMGL